MKTGVVTKIIHNTGQFTNKMGQVNYKHEVTFNNGDSGIYNALTDTCLKFVEGEMGNYEIRNNEPYGFLIKYVDPSYQKPQQPQKPIVKNNSQNKSFALSYAKDIAVAHIAQGKDFKAAQIIEVAKVFDQWLSE